MREGLRAVSPAAGLGSWPWRRARISPDRPALIYPPGTRRAPLTYAELAERTDQLAGALAARGVRPGDRVAYLGVNAVSVFELYFAAWRLGAIVVPLNYRLSPAEIGYMLADSGAVLLVFSEDAGALVAQVDPAVCPPSLMVGTEYEDAIAAAHPAGGPDPGLDALAMLLYTSGTTGRPKAAALTHGNLTWNTVNQLVHADVLSTDRALCISPLFHCVGLSLITLPTLLKGGSVEPVAQFDPGAILARIATAGITGFSGVPTMLQMMAEHPDWPATDLSSLRTVIFGGAPVQERVAAAWLDRGVQLQQGYGMTETSPGVYMVPPEGSPDRSVSVGVPHFFTDVATLEGDTLGPLAAEPAELLVRGPNVFPGYWNRPVETAAAFTGDWFHTGDVLRAGPHGWADVVDRVKDMIISGGENIYPAEIEAVLVQLDEIESAAVVGVPDARWGEVGVAYVQLRPGATITDLEIRAHLAANLAGYKLPKRLELLDDLPRNAAGKILKTGLRARAGDQTGRIR